ncbi:MAG: lipoprotein [Myxococcota bacterium]
MRDPRVRAILSAFFFLTACGIKGPPKPPEVSPPPPSTSTVAKLPDAGCPSCPERP